nr:MAG TPA: hypothetical protein [Caudoviricetes sp.]
MEMALFQLGRKVLLVLINYKLSQIFLTYR